jgi:hypothetical protein
VESRKPFRSLTANRSIYLDIIVLVLLFNLLQVLAGVFPGTPINDDWAYTRILEEFVRTGRFIPLGWIGMNLFTQTILAYPFVKVFGSGWSTLHLFTLVMGSGVIALTLVWMRQLGASRAMTFAVALGWMANPIFFGLSGSFMTDVPFLCLLLLCLIFANRSIADEKSVSVFVLFVLSVVSAMLLRQPALLLAIAFAVASFEKDRGWANVRLLIPILCAVIAQLLFDHWLSQTGANLEMRRYLIARVFDHAKRLWQGDQEAWKFILHSSVEVPSYVAMMAIPLLPFWFQGVKVYWSDTTSKQRWGIIAAFTMGCLVVGLAGIPPFRRHNANVIEPFGLGPFTLRDGMFVESWSVRDVPVAFWTGVWCLTALTGGMMFATWAGFLQKEKAWKQPEFRMIAVFMVLYSAIFILIVYIDRYGLPITLCVATVLAKITRRKKREISIFGWVWLFAWVALAVIAAHDYQAWQHARWRAAQDLLAEGIDPRRVDGGFEFNGYYLYGRANSPPGKSWWWVADDEYLIAFSSEPFPNYRPVSIYRVSGLLPTTPKQVLVLRRKEEN